MPEIVICLLRAQLAIEAGTGWVRELAVRRVKNLSLGTTIALTVLWAVPTAGEGSTDLLERYDDLVAAIARSPFAEPIHIESEEKDRSIQGNVYAIVHHPFESLTGALRAASVWCETTLLHLNVKACFYVEGGGTDDAFVRLYVGRKRYQELEDADAVDLRLRISAYEENYYWVTLEGDRGPHGTRDFQLNLEAVPYGEYDSLIRFRYSLTIGGAMNVFLQFYFATAGHRRVGFTVIDVDEQGKPVYVRGLRGMIERNTMRFYLALEAYLATLDTPRTERLEQRLRHWFALTERYPTQLRELDEKTYVGRKLREYERQKSLQAQIDARLREDNPQALR